MRVRLRHNVVAVVEFQSYSVKKGSRKPTAMIFYPVT